jgi:hypothetical protein
VGAHISRTWLGPWLAREVFDQALEQEPTGSRRISCAWLTRRMHVDEQSLKCDKSGV